MLYQLSYASLIYRGAHLDRIAPQPSRDEAVERETGIEPATNSLEGCDSTIELLPPWKTNDPLHSRQPKLVRSMLRKLFCAGALRVS